MKFGSILVEQAEGCILAHGVRGQISVFKKGKLLSAQDIAELQKAGVRNIVVARLETSDMPEDLAAQKIAAAASGPSSEAQAAFTGRANIYAREAGIVLIDESRVKALNHLHESLTLATLIPFARVEKRSMIATIKVIPFAMPVSVYEAALNIIGDVPLVKVMPFQKLRVGLIITKLPQTKDSLIAKSEAAIRDRIENLNGEIADVLVVAHEEAAVAAALSQLDADVVLVFGASAIVDRADVIPAGVIAAGGQVLHLGMPVDPGNLLMLGKFKDKAVIGVPSCARSPKTNGFDWVLQRIMAGIEVRPADIMDMGAGGLLAEIPSRPSPREPKSMVNLAPRIGAVVLAAGTSTRMGSNKLLADVQGKPMIVQTVTCIAASQIENIVVVVGNDAQAIQLALQNCNVSFVENPYYADGLSTSLRAGVAALQNSCDAILVCLGDMPLIDPRDINRMIAAFNPTEHRNIVVPVFERTFGNPVLWGAEHFMALLACDGDRGARSLLEKLEEDVVQISVDNQSVILDADTPEALATIRSIAGSAN